MREDANLILLREDSPNSDEDRQIAQTFLSELYSKKHVIDFRGNNFEETKAQLLELLDRIIELNPQDFNVFRQYRNNLANNLHDKCSRDDLYAALDDVKKVLEIAFLTIKAQPNKVQKSTLDAYAVHACFSGAADNIKTIANKFMAKTFEEKIVQAKKELLLSLAVDYIRVQNLLIIEETGESLEGDEIHLARGFFNAIAAQYGLLPIRDALIPMVIDWCALSDFCDDYVRTHFNFRNAVNCFMIEHPAPTSALSIESIMSFLESIGADGEDFDRLYEREYSEKSGEINCQPRKQIELHYEWLLFDLLVRREYLRDYKYVLTNPATACVKLGDQIFIADISQHQYQLELPSFKHRELIVSSVDSLLAASGCNLSLFSTDTIPFFIESLSRCFYQSLFYALVNVITDPNHDRQLANILNALSDAQLCGDMPLPGVNPQEAFWVTIERGLFFTTDALLKRVADMNRIRVLDGSALLHAVVAGRYHLISWLRVCGEHINFPNSAGLTGLSLAIIQGNEWLVALLVAGGADVNRRGFNNITPLLEAAYYRQPRILNCLLAYHARLIPTSTSCETAMNVAVKNNDLLILQMLIQNIKSRMNQAGYSSFRPYSNKEIASPMKINIRTLLHSLIPQEDQIRKARLDNLIRPKLRNSAGTIYGFSTLHMAIALGHTGMIHALKNAMSVDAYNQFGCVIGTQELEDILMPKNDLRLSQLQMRAV